MNYEMYIILSLIINLKFFICFYINHNYFHSVPNYGNDVKVEYEVEVIKVCF